ncbi:MAG: hypothetical protein U5K72_17590 [Balneolaceae bacterium]|nr:hypothetical protein [Balneolaceae bacterium]
MDRDIKIYDVHDPQQYEDDKEYWQNKTPEEKLHALEIIRHAGDKLGIKQNGDEQRLRRVYKIIERE